MSATLNQQISQNTEQRVWTIDWHPDGKFLASAGSNKNVNIWSFDSNALKLTKFSTIETQHTKTIRSVKFSHKGDKIAVASFDSRISVWIYNTQNEQFETLSILDGHQNEVKCVAWSNDDKKIASCSRDKNIWIWQFDNISYDYTCEEVLSGHTQDVKFVDWFPNKQNKLVSCSYDNSIRVWQMEDDEYICKHVLQCHNSIVWTVQFCGLHLFSASQDCTVIDWLYSQSHEKYQCEIIYQGLHFFPIYSLCIMKNKYLLTGGGDNSICLTQIISQKTQNKKQKVIAVCKVQHESDVNCLKVNPHDENLVASCSDDETIRIWKLTQH